MAGLGLEMANDILDTVFRGQAWTPITGVEAGLHNADPGTSGANEIVGVDRQAVAFNAAAGGVVAVTTNVPFTNMPGSDVLYISYWGDDGRYIGSGPNGAVKEFTAAAATDVLTAAAHGYADGMTVALLTSPTATLPAGVAADTIYYVRDATANTFRLALTPGGVAIDLTSDGGGRVRRAQRVATGETFTILAGSTVGVA